MNFNIVQIFAIKVQWWHCHSNITVSVFLTSRTLPKVVSFPPGLHVVTYMSNISHIMPPQWSIRNITMIYLYIFVTGALWLWDRDFYMSPLVTQRPVLFDTNMQDTLSYRLKIYLFISIKIRQHYEAKIQIVFSIQHLFMATFWIHLTFLCSSCWSWHGRIRSSRVIAWFCKFRGCVSRRERHWGRGGKVRRIQRSFSFWLMADVLDVAGRKK